MRKVMLVLAVLGLVGSLWAADSSLGAWKLNIAKSKMPSSTSIKELIAVKKVVGDQFEIVFNQTNTDGNTLTIKYTCPQQGGMIQSAAIPKDSISVLTIISPNESYTTNLQNGKQVMVGHYVVSKDGKTMTETDKGVDDKGKPVEETDVWEKQ